MHSVGQWIILAAIEVFHLSEKIPGFEAETHIPIAGTGNDHLSKNQDLTGKAESYHPESC